MKLRTMIGRAKLHVNREVWSVMAIVGEHVSADAPALFVRYGSKPMSPQIIGEAALAAAQMSQAETAKLSGAHAGPDDIDGWDKWENEIQQRSGARSATSARKPMILVQFEMLENEYCIGGTHQLRLDFWQMGKCRFPLLRKVSLPNTSSATEIGEAIIEVAKNCRSVFGPVFLEDTERQMGTRTDYSSG